MTRAEFIDEVQNWSELIDFCNDEGCNYCEDIYDDYQKDEYFDDQIVEMARNAEGWQDLLDSLRDIPDGSDYYRRDDYGEWYAVDDDDFDNYKQDILEWADDNDIWEEEEEENVDEEESSDDEDDFDEEKLEEGCSLGELFTSCNTRLQTIEQAREQEKEQEERNFEQLIAAAM